MWDWLIENWSLAGGVQDVSSMLFRYCHVQLFFVLLRRQTLFNNARSICVYLKAFPSAKLLPSIVAYIIFLKQSIEVSGCDWNLSAKILQYLEVLGKAFLKLQFLEPWEKNGISISFFKKENSSPSLWNKTGKCELGSSENRNELKDSNTCALLLIYLFFGDFLFQETLFIIFDDSGLVTV